MQIALKGLRLYCTKNGSHKTCFLLSPSHKNLVWLSALFQQVWGSRIWEMHLRGLRGCHSNLHAYEFPIYVFYSKLETIPDGDTTRPCSHFYWTACICITLIFLFTNLSPTLWFRDLEFQIQCKTPIYWYENRTFLAKSLFRMHTNEV